MFPRSDIKVRLEEMRICQQRGVEYGKGKNDSSKGNKMCKDPEVKQHDAFNHGDIIQYGERRQWGVRITRIELHRKART